MNNLVLKKEKKKKVKIMMMMLKKMFLWLIASKLLVLSAGKVCTKWRHIKEERCC
jgi:hypothetical protein